MRNIGRKTEPDVGFLFFAADSKQCASRSYRLATGNCVLFPATGRGGALPSYTPATPPPSSSLDVTVTRRARPSSAVKLTPSCAARTMQPHSASMKKQRTAGESHHCCLLVLFCFVLFAAAYVPASCVSSALPQQNIILGLIKIIPGAHFFPVNRL
jgi:hypothetical protein